MVENIILTFVFWLAIVLAVAIGSIVWVQNSLLFYPNTSIFNWSPDNKNIVNYNEREGIIQINPTQVRVEVIEQDIMIPDGNGGISAYYINNFPGNNFLLYCHGTSGNIADRKYAFDIAQEHQLNLLLFDYHGYGKSPGYPSVEGILKDGITAIDFLTQTKGIPLNKIIPWGESLGGSVAAYIAKHRRVKGVVLMATFSSMPDLIANMDKIGWIRFPLSMIAKITLNPLATARWIAGAKMPIVVMHSREDNYIPYDCGFINYEIAKEPKHLIDIEGTHISPIITPGQITEALTFIEENKSS